MSKFKAGDRVRVYSGKMRFKARVHAALRDGTLLLVDQPEWARGVLPHEKQCRKLVKKARRTVWARFDCEGLVADFAGKKQHGPGWVEFREVRAKR